MTRILLVIVITMFVATLAGCGSGNPPEMFTARSFVCQDLATAQQAARQSYNCLWKQEQVQGVLFSYHARTLWWETEVKGYEKHLPKVLDLSLAKPGDYVALPTGCGNQILDRDMTLVFPNGKQYIARCVWNDEDWLDDATVTVITNVRPVEADRGKPRNASNALLKAQPYRMPPGPPIKPLQVSVWRSDGSVINECLLAPSSMRLDAFLQLGEAEIPLHACRPFMLKGGESARITADGKSYLGTVSIRRPCTTSLYLNNFRREKL